MVPLRATNCGLHLRLPAIPSIARRAREAGIDLRPLHRRLGGFHRRVGSFNCALAVRRRLRGFDLGPGNPVILHGVVEVLLRDRLLFRERRIFVHVLLGPA